jgi:hypothetical protein
VIIVKRPAGEVVAENTVVIPDPVMARKYQEALGQLKVLQSATSQTARTQIKEVVVEKIVDNPDIVARLNNALDHISVLERARIDLQAKVMARQALLPEKLALLPSQMPPERVEIQTIKVVISKAWMIAAALSGAGVTLLLTRLLHAG